MGTACRLVLLKPQGPPPEGVVSPESSPTPVSNPGRRQHVHGQLRVGRTYVTLCFVGDKKGGPPHAIAHRMFKVFTVE
jgi:hypothetical protein